MFKKKVNQFIFYILRRPGRGSSCLKLKWCVLLDNVSSDHSIQGLLTYVLECYFPLDGELDGVDCYIGAPQWSRLPVFISYEIILLIDTELGHVTFSGQWYIGKHGPSKDLMSACTLELVILAYSLLEVRCAIEKLGVAYSTMRNY